MPDTDFPDLPAKALSIRQPWVWAILNAGKRIENRPRRFHYRGLICLHASLYKPNAQDGADFTQTLIKAVPDFKKFARQASTMPPEMKGGIIGTAEIVDCVEQSDDPWFFGPYGLVLENVQPVKFIPVKGALGLFNWRKNL
ncbi:hypothetical protein [Roseovarius sp. MMSF_3281]|uniref:hypothetical protein n=1 Tax=Roseovarius sp. MMSF_3281 TaxID=3046694 RepID=UPI00273E038A|nr:hypothetical protein [Roseovarius sp. MMSF_3281]